MFKYTALLLTVFFTSTFFAQTKSKTLKKAKESPVYFIDSLNVTEAELMTYEPNEIAVISIYKDKEATDLIGKQGKDGVLYIETISFAKKRYRKYFSSKSEDYAKLVQFSEADKNIQYILNEEVLTKDFEGDLSNINDSNFKSIKVIEKETLKSEYGINNKDHGVVLVADVSKDQ